MKIHSKIKDYTAEVLDDVLQKKKRVFTNITADRLFYFVDQNFYDLYKGKVDHFIGDDTKLIIEAHENNKSYSKLTDYYRFLIENRFTRNDVLVTFGGGILQDISGFIASTLYRGIKWVYFPTTLLAQADSCIGSKTSINFEESKNLIGTFYPPDLIYIDHTFCETLTDEYFNSGLGEIIKFHLLSDKERFSFLKKYLASENLRTSEMFQDIILSTLEIKKSYFETDEFDTGRRNLLNYGHCLGHALESASNFAVSHGEAVIVGMGFANLLSLKRGILPKEKYYEYEEIFQRFYPRFDLPKVDVADLIHYLKRDKKRVGKDLTMILARGIGDHEKMNDVKESEIVETYGEFIKNYPAGVLQ